MYKNNLIKVREKNKVIQQEIANILEISRSRYSRYEVEYDIMPLKHLIIICDYFKVSLDYIFEFNKQESYDKYIDGIDSKKAGERLKEFRKDNKLTLEKLGKSLNCSYGTIAGYESGRYLISTSFLYELCAKYKISADYLVGKIDIDPINTKLEDIMDKILNIFDNE